MAEQYTDLKIIRKFNLDSSICFAALYSGDIDAYVEYTGTALHQVLKVTTDVPSQEGYEKVKKIFQDKFQLEWLHPFGFENAYAILLKKETAEKYKMSNLSHLADCLPASQGLRIGFDQEFFSREEYRLLRNKYQFCPQKAPLLMDHALLYLSLDNNNIDIMNGYATDGFIIKYNLAVLEDDKQFFPSYLAAPVVRQSILQQHPNLREIFNLLSDRITAKQMQTLNFEVEVQGKTVHQAAYNFLKNLNLICR
ncbi:MAG: glycine betaine ABC transporter substrate-binding protein [Simkaniaceae bacterium]